MPHTSIDPSWMHWIPFAALVTRNAPPNRPLLTRMIEQGAVGLVAGVGGSYVSLAINSAVQDVQIKSLQAQISSSENRMTDEIRELRTQMYEQARAK